MSEKGERKVAGRQIFQFVQPKREESEKEAT